MLLLPIDSILCDVFGNFSFQVELSMRYRPTKGTGNRWLALADLPVSTTDLRGRLSIYLVAIEWILEIKRNGRA